MSLRLLRGYLVFVMAGLFVQGVGSLLFRTFPTWASASPLLVRGLFGIDFWHSWIHILWGAGGAVFLARRRSERDATWLALVFGVFYSLLGVWGVTAHHPLGLELDAYENTFHLTAGPLTLLVGLIAWFRPTAAFPRPAGRDR